MKLNHSRALVVGTDKLRTPTHMVICSKRVRDRFKKMESEHESSNSSSSSSDDEEDEPRLKYHRLPGLTDSEILGDNLVSAAQVCNV